MIKIFLCVRLENLPIKCLLNLLEVDLIRTVTLPHLEPFGISHGLELKVSDYSFPLEIILTHVPRSRNGAHRR
jgi:hypothetical protein